MVQHALAFRVFLGVRSRPSPAQSSTLSSKPQYDFFQAKLGKHSAALSSPSILDCVSFTFCKSTGCHAATFSWTAVRDMPMEQELVTGKSSSARACVVPTPAGSNSKRGHGRRSGLCRDKWLCRKNRSLLQAKSQLSGSGHRTGSRPLGKDEHRLFPVKQNILRNTYVHQHAYVCMYVCIYIGKKI